MYALFWKFMYIVRFSQPAKRYDLETPDQYNDHL